MFYRREPLINSESWSGWDKRCSEGDGNHVSECYERLEKEVASFRERHSTTFFILNFVTVKSLIEKSNEYSRGGKDGCKTILDALEPLKISESEQFCHRTMMRWGCTLQVILHILPIFFIYCSTVNSHITFLSRPA